MTATYAGKDSPRLRAAGWALHAYTASGTAIAFLALTAAVGGEEIAALWWLFLALLIDGTDGMLARRLRVKEVIPNFDGARLDDVVDYITYCFAPVFLLWYGGYLPEGNLGTLVADLPRTYTCTGLAPGTDVTNTATVTGTSPFGDPLTATDGAFVDVINPAIERTMTEVGVTDPDSLVTIDTTDGADQ